MLFSLLIVPAYAQQVPEINGYTADKPFVLYSHESIQGDLYYSTGSSYYSEKLYPGEVYTVSHSVDLPEGSTVKLARLYNYWIWSAEGITGRDPEMKLSFNEVELEPDSEYSDRKGWGMYDYPSGTWAYNVSTYINNSGTFSTSIENTGPETSYFCIDGIGLLIVYTDPNGNDIEYWISEGADELNSQMDENGNPLYYASPNQTICDMLSPNVQFPIDRATLWTVTQAGNWEDNLLQVNSEEFSGICNGKPYPDLDIDTRDVTDYLTSGENIIRLQAVGDYVIPSNSFLVIERSSDNLVKEEDLWNTETADDENPGNSENEAPGFSIGLTIATLTAGKFAALRRQQNIRK
jgi:hypothetical protein